MFREVFFIDRDIRVWYPSRSPWFRVHTDDESLARTGSRILYHRHVNLHCGVAVHRRKVHNRRVTVTLIPSDTHKRTPCVTPSVLLTQDETQERTLRRRSTETRYSCRRSWRRLCWHWNLSFDVMESKIKKWESEFLRKFRVQRVKKSPNFRWKSNSLGWIPKSFTVYIYIY